MRSMCYGDSIFLAGAVSLHNRLDSIRIGSQPKPAGRRVIRAAPANVNNHLANQNKFSSDKILAPESGTLSVAG